MASEVEVLLEELRAVVRLARPEPLTVPVEEAARRLSVSRNTVLKMIRAGVLLTVKIGERRMVPTAELYRVASPMAGPTRAPAPAGPRN